MGPFGAHLAEAVDRLALLVLRAGQRPFQPGLFGGHGARPVVDPDMVVLVDIEPADLAENPVVRQRLRPGGIDHEVRRLAGRRGIVHARLLEQPLERAALFQDVDIGVGALAAAVIHRAATAAITVRRVVMPVSPGNRSRASEIYFIAA